MISRAVLAELAHTLGAVPLLWLYVLVLLGKHRGAEWWWLATAFGVSWLADTAAHWANPLLPSAVYPVSQVGLIGAVLLYHRADAIRLLIVLTAAGIVAVHWRAATEPDVLLHTVAWGAAAGIAWNFRALGRLRMALLVYFGLGLVGWFMTTAWIYHCGEIRSCKTAWPGSLSWGTLQTARLLGTALFCWAAASPGPQLRVERESA